MKSNINILEKCTNEIFEISFSNFSTSGFVWSLKVIPDQIILLEEKIELTDNSIGGAAKNIFILKGIAQGEYILKFALGRIWEKNQINESEYKIIIKNCDSA